MKTKLEFSQEQIAILRKHYDALERVDPCSEVWLDFRAFVQTLVPDCLAQLERENIKWVSYLGREEIKRRAALKIV